MPNCSEIESLERMLAASRGTFSLSVAICNAPTVRDQIIEHLATAVPEIATIAIPSDEIDIFGFAQRAVGSSRRDALFIVDLERTVPSEAVDQPSLRALNASRELWRSFGCPVVFWVPEYVVRLLPKFAPDLWAWKSHQFEIALEIGEAISLTDDSVWSGVVPRATRTEGEKRARIAELAVWLKEAGETPVGPLLPHVSAWLNEIAFLHLTLGECAAAESALRRSVALHEQMGRRDLVAADVSNLGILEVSRGNLAAAETLLRRALREDSDGGALAARVAADQARLANVLRKQGRLTEAEELYLQAIEAMTSAKDEVGLTVTTAQLASVYAERGDLDRAEQLYGQAITRSRQVSDAVDSAALYTDLGALKARRGALIESSALHRRAIAVAEESGHLRQLAVSLGNLGNTLVAQGQPDEAAEVFERARKIFERVGDHVGVAVTLQNQGIAAWALGRPSKAERLFRHALTLFREIGMRVEEARAYANLGSLAVRDRPGEARGLLERALAIFRQTGLPLEESKVRRQLADLGGSQAAPNSLP